MHAYSFFYGLFYLLVRAAALFSSKVRRGIEGRRELLGRVRAQCEGWAPGCFWFHVSSSGELEQALPIMDEIRRRQLNRKMFLSYFSPSGANAIRLERERREKRGLAVPWDAADYSPADFKKEVTGFLDALRPACFVGIHREVWPRLVHECHQRQIPCYLFAAFFSRGSRKWWPVYRRALSEFKMIGTTEADSQAFLRGKLPEARVEMVGDSRVERVLSRRALVSESAWASFFENQRILIFASVWKKDFTALQPTLDMLLKNHPEWRLVLTPHEPSVSFVREMSDWFKNRGSRARLWTRWLLEPDSHSHLIVDSVGLLAELYGVATLVFVGGSFTRRVHNVLEPAAYGRPIFTGPLISNSSEATEMAEHSHGLISVRTSEDLAREVESLVTDPDRIREQSARLSAFLQTRTGASRRYADILEGH